MDSFLLGAVMVLCHSLCLGQSFLFSLSLALWRRRGRLINEVVTDLSSMVVCVQCVAIIESLFGSCGRTMEASF